MKTCIKCGNTKQDEDFHGRANGGDGLRNSCKECMHVSHAAWREQNREKIKVQKTAYRAANPSKIKARNAAWYAANTASAKEKSKAWQASNQDKVKVNQAAWHALNKEKTRARQAAWSVAHPEACRIKSHNRRARQIANSGKLSQGLQAKLFKLQHGKCACCGLPLGDDYHLDHIMPLALGGSNTDSNIQLLRQRCNGQKGAKHPINFMQMRGFLL